MQLVLPLLVMVAAARQRHLLLLVLAVQGLLQLHMRAAPSEPAAGALAGLHQLAPPHCASSG